MRTELMAKNQTLETWPRGIKARQIPIEMKDLKDGYPVHFRTATGYRLKEVPPRTISCVECEA